MRNTTHLVLTDQYSNLADAIINKSSLINSDDKLIVFSCNRRIGKLDFNFFINSEGLVFKWGVKKNWRSGFERKEDLRMELLSNAVPLEYLAYDLRSKIIEIVKGFEKDVFID